MGSVYVSRGGTFVCRRAAKCSQVRGRRGPVPRGAAGGCGSEPLRPEQPLRRRRAGGAGLRARARVPAEAGIWGFGNAAGAAGPRAPPPWAGGGRQAGRGPGEKGRRKPTPGGDARARGGQGAGGRRGAGRSLARFGFLAARWGVEAASRGRETRRSGKGARAKAPSSDVSPAPSPGSRGAGAGPPGSRRPRKCTISKGASGRLRPAAAPPGPSLQAGSQGQWQSCAHLDQIRSDQTSAARPYPRVRHRPQQTPVPGPPRGGRASGRGARAGGRAPPGIQAAARGSCPVAGRGFDRGLS